MIRLYSVECRGASSILSPLRPGALMALKCQVAVLVLRRPLSETFFLVIRRVHQLVSITVKDQQRDTTDLLY